MDVIVVVLVNSVVCYSNYSDRERHDHSYNVSRNYPPFLPITTLLILILPIGLYSVRACTLGHLNWPQRCSWQI